MELDKTGKRRLKWTVIVVTLIAVLLIAFWPRETGPSPFAAAADSMYQPPLVKIQPRSDEQSPFRQGMAAFSDKDWDSAITLFSGIDNSNPVYLESTFFLGHSLYGKGDYKRAAEVFDELHSIPNQYSEKAEWNAILARMHLKVSREEIIDQLRPIWSDENGEFQERAMQLNSALPNE